MIHRIEIYTRPSLLDPAGQALQARLRRFTDFAVRDVRTLAVYAFDSDALGGPVPRGDGAPQPLAELGAGLFGDPVLNECRTDGAALKALPWDWYIEVGFRPGVTDNVGRTARESLEQRLGRPGADGHQVHTATGYFVRGRLSRAQAQALAADWLGNALIQRAVVLSRGDLAWPNMRQRLFQLPTVTLAEKIRVRRFALDSAKQVLALSQARLLALNPEEFSLISTGPEREDTIILKDSWLQRTIQA